MEEIVCGYRNFCLFIISVVFCVGFRVSGFEFWFSVLFQVRVLVMLYVGSFFIEKVLVYFCVLVLDLVLREGRDYFFCGVGFLLLDWLFLELVFIVNLGVLCVVLFFMLQGKVVLLLFLFFYWQKDVRVVSIVFLFFVFYCGFLNGICMFLLSVIIIFFFF